MALLLFLDTLDYQSQYGDMLIDIDRKKINTEHNNDRDLTQDYVDTSVYDRGQNVEALHIYCQELAKKIEEMRLEYL